MATDSKAWNVVSDLAELLGVPVVTETSYRVQQELLARVQRERQDLELRARSAEEALHENERTVAKLDKRINEQVDRIAELEQMNLRQALQIEGHNQAVEELAVRLCEAGATPDTTLLSKAAELGRKIRELQSRNDNQKAALDGVMKALETDTIDLQFGPNQLVADWVRRAKNAERRLSERPALVQKPNLKLAQSIDLAQELFDRTKRGVV